MRGRVRFGQNVRHVRVSMITFEMILNLVKCSDWLLDRLRSWLIVHRRVVWIALRVVEVLHLFVV